MIVIVIVIVPEKRRDGRSSFLQLISYLVCRVDKKPGELLSPDNPYVRPLRSREAIVEHLGQFIEEGMDLYRNHVLSRSDDGRQQVLCGEFLCETNSFGIETAAAEMDAVASQNRRCQDPVYHAILSWREEDNPTNEQIFECARYALKALNMSDHQYVIGNPVLYSLATYSNFSRECLFTEQDELCPSGEPANGVLAVGGAAGAE